MPHFTILVEPRGAIAQVVVSVTGARRKALEASGVPVPAPVVASLLIDTGASMTCLCTSVITKLSLQPTGTINILTPSTGTTSHQCATYDVDVMMPAMAGIKHLAAIPVVESDFSTQGHQGLIGRDILKDFRMTYSGPDKLVLLSF